MGIGPPNVLPVPGTGLSFVNGATDWLCTQPSVIHYLDALKVGDPVYDSIAISSFIWTTPGAFATNYASIENEGICNTGILLHDWDHGDLFYFDWAHGTSPVGGQNYGYVDRFCWL